jgi:hypothetical protein
MFYQPVAHHKKQVVFIFVQLLIYKTFNAFSIHFSAVLGSSELHFSTLNRATEIHFSTVERELFLHFFAGQIQVPNATKEEKKSL